MVFYKLLLFIEADILIASNYTKFDSFYQDACLSDIRVMRLVII